MLLESVKSALRITVDDYDTELNDLISAGLLDLGLAGVVKGETDALIKRAVITYCKINFGNCDNYDALKASYDEQKAQLGMASGYTNWSE